MRPVPPVDYALGFPRVDRLARLTTTTHACASTCQMASGRLSSSFGTSPSLSARTPHVFGTSATERFDTPATHRPPPDRRP